MTMDILPRADTIEERFNRAQRGQMSDEGLRNWYVRDISDLMQQLMALRRERTTTLETLRKLPIEVSSNTTDEAAQAVVLFEDATAGLWQKAEVGRLREKTSAAVTAQREAEQRATQAEQARVQAEQLAADATRAAQDAQQQQQQARVELEALRAQYQALVLRLREMLGEL